MLAGVGFFVMLVLYLGILFLALWGTYWLISLAVRHGTMDTARWQRPGMPDRMPKRVKRRPPKVPLPSSLDDRPRARWETPDQTA
ncbi:hypothetical protein DY023_16565 [Microbacterium bovistercoris]|uniref:Uncharacterized protein n=1 Tax=Microbacterium bovistercoris TaxID=2293570 RepID=A0A371NP41_9MICO|nr:hypothetical protein [Microbacterium bovistercoris]REJ03928.1 hypothetical protein DY023_16565 [Microbacterium bovistercoris]